MSALTGRTEYGDSIEDEWIVVWLLKEISKQFSDAWIKISDNDGEFLLIEASATIPAWLEPEVAENRVWINDGSLKILKPSNSSRSSRKTSEKLSFVNARQIILEEPKRIMHSTLIEEEAFFRLKDYPDKIKDNMHHTSLRIPRQVAFLLKQKPSYVSPAIESFYLRDPISLKPIQTAATTSDLIFKPDDIVKMSVKMPRIGYAQLRFQEFPPPQIWKSSVTGLSDKVLVQSDTGMKLACGFEILLTDPHHQDKQVVREIKMLLDDVAQGDEHLPTNEEIATWDTTEDSEAWLDIDFNELENELKGKKSTGFGDKAAQENLQRIAKQFESFMNEDKTKDTGEDLFGQDSDDTEDVNGSDDDVEEDKDASFNEAEFSKMMQELMGMPEEVMNELMKGKLPEHDVEAGHVEEDSSEIDEDDSELQQLTQHMEQELRSRGALQLDPSLASQTRAKGKQKQEIEEDSEDDLEDNDIDPNLLKALMENFKGQSRT